MKNTIHIFLVFACFLYGCKFNATFQNRESDKNDAAQITNSFYSLLQLDQLKQAESLFSDTFFSAAGREGLPQLIGRSNNEFGKILKDSLIHWQTTVVHGTNAHAVYMLVYDVTRTKKHTIETFFLRKEAEGIKITGYNVSYNISVQ